MRILNIKNAFTLGFPTIDWGQHANRVANHYPFKNELHTLRKEFPIKFK